MWGPAWLGSGINRSWDGLAHISDIGLTLLDAAGVAPLPPLPGRPLHGTSLWDALTRGGAPPRTEVIVNVDYTAPSQAAVVRADGWKLIVGTAGDATNDYWSDRQGEPETPPPCCHHPLYARQLHSTLALPLLPRAW